MKELGDVMDQSFADANAEFAPALRELAQQRAAAERSLEESRQALAEVQQELERRRAAGPVETPPLPEEVFDPAVVRQLRDELLGRSAPRPSVVSATPLQSLGDAQDLTTGAFQVSSVAPQVAAAAQRHDRHHRPTAPAPDAADSSSDEWRNDEQ